MSKSSVVTTRVRVRYAETDKMGVVYHANYFVWFEIGRVEFLRNLGFDYKQMEVEDDCHLPVVEANCRYRASALYDDELLIETRVTAMKSFVLKFGYRLLRAADMQLLAEAETTHVLCDHTMAKKSFPEKYACAIRSALAAPDAPHPEPTNIAAAGQMMSADHAALTGNTHEVKSMNETSATTAPGHEIEAAAEQTAENLVTEKRAEHIRWADVEIEKLNAHIGRQFLVGTNVMLARFLLKKGAVVPLHSHHNEQVSYVLKGAIKFVLQGRDVTVGAGEVLCIPPDVPHEAHAVEDVVALDVFSPPRQDWIGGDDAYLREGTAAMK